MIKAILTGIINLLISLINIVLAPIDSIINSTIPSISDALDSINVLFNYMNNFVGWVVDSLCLTPLALEIICATITARLTIPLLIHTIKLVMSWYDKLKV